MRALVVGLVGVGFAAGGAWAAVPETCSTEAKLLLVSRPAETPSFGLKVQRTDLVGKEFRIVGLHHRGHVALTEIASGNLRLLVKTEVFPHSAPGTYISSHQLRDRTVPQALRSAPMHRSSRQPYKTAGGYVSDIRSGPLAGMDLEVKGCRL